MTLLQLAQIQQDAEKAERQRIAFNIRMLASQEEAILNKRNEQTRDSKHISILRNFADMIERGDFSQ